MDTKDPKKEPIKGYDLTAKLAPRSSTPEEDMKPPKVKIIAFTTVAFPNERGAVTLLINGLGDDGMIYKYDGIKKEWTLQL